VSWQLRFWGVRGSVPSPGPRTARYGGNTPCVEVRGPGGDLVILDAGTGIRECGKYLAGPVDARIFLTHGHWDHIQGLPFFAPLYQAGSHIRIHGPRPESGAGGLKRAIEQQMSSVVFPVSLAQAGAQVECSELDAGVVAGAGYEIRTIQVQHPGGALGYRFTETQRAGDAGASFVYVSDNELLMDGGAGAAGRRALVAFAHEADLLVHDATYGEKEIERHRGWGHSSDREAVELALECRAKRLALYHHHPDRSDEEIDRRTDDCRRFVQECGGNLDVFSAAEGLSLTV
jgi:phosphoribosyl 1,2-cyclic phosphodiesterase